MSPASAPPVDHLVELPTGASWSVLTEQEADYVRQRVSTYTDEYKFGNTSDLAELDRVIQFETMLHRWHSWLGTGKNYAGKAIADGDLRADIKAASLELRQIKKTLGIDKTTRDKAKGEGSVPQFIATLLQRANEFGIHRDKQTARAIELINELIGHVTFYRNADDDMRREFGLTGEEILEWIWEVMRPEFQEIDLAFQQNQKLWIRSL